MFMGMISVYQARRAVTGALSRFRREEDASLSVEAVLVIPLLLWAFIAIFTFFDLYRAKNLALKANYAISDLLSRENTAIDMNYLEGTERLYEFITQTTPDPWVRVTMVYCDSDCGKASRTLKRDWSKATDGLATYTDGQVMSILEPIVPWLAEQERVIVVETSVDYEPPFSQNFTGIGGRTFVDVVMTRHRFADKLCWDGIECGKN